MSVFGKTKKAIVSEFIDLEGSPADDFWQIYNAYDEASKELHAKRMDLLEVYAKAYMILTDPRTDEIIKDLATQKKNLDELIFKYYKKMNKTDGIKPAAEFYQIENYFISAIRLEIFKNISFIGEN